MNFSKFVGGIGFFLKNKNQVIDYLYSIAQFFTFVNIFEGWKQ